MITYHLLHFLNPVQHPGVMKELGWKHRTTSETDPLAQPVVSLVPAWEWAWVCGRRKGKINTTFGLCSLDAQHWPCFYLQWEPGRMDDAWSQDQSVGKTMWHFHISHLLLFLPSLFLAFLPFLCHYCLLSLLHRQQQRELQKIWHICLLLTSFTWVQGAYFLALSWLWPYHLFTQGKAVRLHCAGDDCPGGIWPRVQETHRVPLAGRSSVSCPTGKLCLNQVQEVLEKLSTCHWDSMMHFPVVRL